MGSESAGFLDFLEDYEYDNQIGFPGSNQTLDFGNGLKSDDPLLDSSSLGFSSVPEEPYTWTGIAEERDSSSPTADLDFSDSVLKYINQVLMEEDMEDKPCMFHDALALQATEKSLYEALGEKYPQNSTQPCNGQNVDSPDGSGSGVFSDCGGTDSTTSSTTTSSDSHLSLDVLDNRPSWLQTPIRSNFVFQSAPKSSVQSLFDFSNGVEGGGENGIFGSNSSNDVVSSMFSNSDLVMQFNKGVEEASKFLPKGNQFLDLGNYKPAVELKITSPALFLKAEKDEMEETPVNRLMGKKGHKRDDDILDEERSNKQSAVFVDEDELSDMFDKLLTCGKEDKTVCILDEPANAPHQKSKSTTAQQNGQEKGTKARGKKPGNGKDNKREVVDLRTLLILCAQAVSGDDRRTAHEFLKQIRQHSSPSGNGSQRLAHYFADSLEARLNGTGTQIYTVLSSKKTSAADMLRAYEKYMSVCPFKKIGIIFANHSLGQPARNAKTVHIIDFGISYGFQWPGMIQKISLIYGNSIKLRITGIELPQRGFRPAEGVEETGRRLAKYCERHNVPFEYHAIAQKWETIKVEDLKIKQDEFVAVNSLFRFSNLLDETVTPNSPRDTVLKLIREINPNVFVHAILSGSINAPFFVTRFREALFHYSGLFDMYDTTLPRDDPMRSRFEKEFYGREIMNVVACEGTERVERPETYKQWQVRIGRAGFRQLPLDPELVQKVRCKVRNGYHKDFVVGEDRNWLLQGWKGRTVYASSLWVPS